MVKYAIEKKPCKVLKSKAQRFSGYQIYHNYFRPHEALNGKTPADKCGIIIEGENKWKTVIENAAKEEAI